VRSTAAPVVVTPVPSLADRSLAEARPARPTPKSDARGDTSGERYVLKDFAGSSHRLLAAWLRGLPPGRCVLELGPGVGHVALLTGRRDLAWLGLESCLDCIGYLRAPIDRGAILDLDLLPRLPGRWDAVVAADVLEHLVDHRRMLEHIRNALSPDGRFFVSVPNVANVWVRLSLLFGSFRYQSRGILDRTHRYFFTRTTLREELARAGFRVVEEAASTIPLPLVFPRAPRLLLAAGSSLLSVLTRLAPRLFGYQLLAIAVAADAPHPSR
jgi:SAM-dependent methyltransferase